MYKLPLSAEEIKKRLLDLPEGWHEIAQDKYDPTSQYAQSGIAVAEALASLYTHYIGTEIDQYNYTSVNYLSPSFKENDIYINNSEKCMYQCVSAEPLNDGSGASHYTWQVIGKFIDEDFELSSTKIHHDGILLSSILNTYLLNIDYGELAFDTTELVINSSTSISAILGQAILGQLVLA